MASMELVQMYKMLPKTQKKQIFLLTVFKIKQYCISYTTLLKFKGVTPPDISHHDAQTHVCL